MGFWLNTDIGLFTRRACLTSLHFSAAPKLGFNGDSVAVPYLRNVRTTKEATMKLTIVASHSAFDDNKWTSYSHWGMFPVQ
jgi:hypothetical protein